MQQLAHRETAQQPRIHRLPFGVHVLPPMLDHSDITRILAEVRPSVHHDDDGHGISKKPSNLPWVAKKIWPFVSGLRNMAYSVDPLMRLYRLEAGSGAVSPHVDQDYSGPDGTVARNSILIYLNDDFMGGETVFGGVHVAPHGAAGSGLMFYHSIKHEGWLVTRGTKFVLKTDLFTEPC